MTTHYLFDRDCIGRWIEDSHGDLENQPEVDWYYWRKGSFIPDSETIPKPIKFSLRPYNEFSADDSHHMPSYLRAAAPIFSDNLIKALNECGVDNMELHDITITDPDNGEVHTNYKAVNILGLVAAADMEKSNATINPNGPPLIDVDFDGLIIDEDKARHHDFFRLAESTNAIIISDRVKNCLLKKGFEDLAFYETEKVAL